MPVRTRAFALRFRPFEHALGVRYRSGFASCKRAKLCHNAGPGKSQSNFVRMHGQEARPRCGRPAHTGLPITVTRTLKVRDVTSPNMGEESFQGLKTILGDVTLLSVMVKRRRLGPQAPSPSSGLVLPVCAGRRSLVPVRIDSRTR